MLLLSYLRTLFTASFIALAIVACDGSSGGASSGEASELSSGQVGTDIFSDDTASAEFSPERTSNISPNDLEAIYEVVLVESAQDKTHTPYRHISEPLIMGNLVGAKIYIESEYRLEGIYVTNVDGSILEETMFKKNEFVSNDDFAQYDAVFSVPQENFTISVSGNMLSGDSFEGRHAQVFGNQ